MFFYQSFSQLASFPSEIFTKDILKDVMTRINRFNHKPNLERERLDTKSKTISMEKAGMHDTSCYADKSRY